jgi:integrase
MTMPKKKPIRRIPTVRMAKPAGRPIQLRYTDPVRRKEIRISTNTYDDAEAEAQKLELEARLLLGIQPERKSRPVEGPAMAWEQFRQQYSNVQLVLLRDGSVIHAESRLDVAERILKPATLGEVATAEALHRLQARLLAGAESKFARPRSPFTVKGYMGTVLAALNWARLQGWIAVVPQIRKIEVGKLKVMKGRPITGEEFDRMLNKVEAGLLASPKPGKRDGKAKRKYRRSAKAIAEHQKRRQQAALLVAPPWRHLLRGLWESALRLDELMNFSWDIPNTIHPEWVRGRLPTLRIPGELQKNGTDEEIPLLPWLEQVLMETPVQERTGWVFNPRPLCSPSDGSPPQRPTTEWVGRVISRIGKAAGVVVDPGNERTARPPKFASAHDLRRSCAERLRDAGVPPLVITNVMRHASWETTRRHYAPGDVQENAKALQKYLGTPTRAAAESQGAKENASHYS